MLDTERLRIVFLDVDGVLHPADTPSLVSGAEASCVASEDLFLESCMQRLRRIALESGAAIVLSSSWRLEPEGLREVARRLGQWGMQIYDATPLDSSMGSLSRAEEIVCWLREHRENVKAFVVLDDLDLTDSLGPSACVVVDGSAGLAEGDVEAALKVLTCTTGADLIDSTFGVFEERERLYAAGWRPWKKKKKDKTEKKAKKEQSKKDDDIGKEGEEEDNEGEKKLLENHEHTEKREKVRKEKMEKKMKEKKDTPLKKDKKEKKRKEEKEVKQENEESKDQEDMADKKDKNDKEDGAEQETS